MLVAAPRKGSPDARHIDEHLEELTRLVDTAGAEVVGRISQQIASPSPATLIGEGKVEEVGRAVAEWMTHGSSEIDVSASDIARFHPHQYRREHTRRRTTESFTRQSVWLYQGWVQSSTSC